MASKSLLLLGTALALLPVACSGSGQVGESDRPGADSSASSGGTRGGGTTGAGGASQGGAAGAEPGATPGGTSGSSADALLFVPESLDHHQLGSPGSLALVALTLVEGTHGPELYAAVENLGPTPACSPGMVTDFIDRAEQLVGSAGGTLHTATLYRTDGGAGVVLPCLAPGDIAMAAMTLSEDIVIEELASLQHTFPAFVFDDLVPVDGITVSGLRPEPTDTGTVYAGTLDNGLDVPVSDPRIVVFPVNRVGRPLGVGRSSAPIELPPAGSWTFETTQVPNAGVGAEAFPAVTLAP